MLQFLMEVLGNWAIFKMDRLGPRAVRPAAYLAAAIIWGLVAVCGLLLIGLLTGGLY